VFGACVLAVLLGGCGYANPVAPGETPTAVHVPPAAQFEWHQFRVHLEPTVLVWAEESHVRLASVVRTALERIEGTLRGSPTSISIMAGSYWKIPDVGIGGDTDRRTGEVKISMDARSPVPVEQMLTVWVPVAMAHELHHSKRIIDGPGYGSTLLDAIVTEGSAEAFVRQMYPAAPTIPWVQPLPAGQERAVWTRAQPVLSAPDDIDLHQAWFVGGGALPRWPGYRIGYAIATRYLGRHGHTNAAALAMLPTARIFTESGYAQAMNTPVGHGA
jgi:hypothetical protein